MWWLNFIFNKDTTKKNKLYKVIHLTDREEQDYIDTLQRERISTYRHNQKELQRALDFMIYKEDLKEMTTELKEIQDEERFKNGE